VVLTLLLTVTLVSVGFLLSSPTCLTGLGRARFRPLLGGEACQSPRKSFLDAGLKSRLGVLILSKFADGGALLKYFGDFRGDRLKILQDT
jgi:hypothetical protein